MDINDIKAKFGIVGNDPALLRALDVARQIAPTDMSVLIIGESGVGKEVLPKIIHQLSARKHSQYIAVNCGAIPEGTIDSELFGHEKGSFTGAVDGRKGYFEVADGGTIFLDEVAELPLSTQVRLLRVLETGEYMRVGSSKVMKTNVRICAATNVNIPEAIAKGKFRQDLYYRLNQVPINMPPLRDRGSDIELLFRKFAADFSEKYKVPIVRLTPEASRLLINYRWEGNIRQLKNITEQISILEQRRDIDENTLSKYLPRVHGKELPVLVSGSQVDDIMSEREILYKVLFDMRKEINELKNAVKDMVRIEGAEIKSASMNDSALSALSKNSDERAVALVKSSDHNNSFFSTNGDDKFMNRGVEELSVVEHEIIEEELSLEKKERDIILKALEKNNNKRKQAAEDLGISERTLYRKIKEYDI